MVVGDRVLPLKSIPPVVLSLLAKSSSSLLGVAEDDCHSLGRLGFSILFYYYLYLFIYLGFSVLMSSPGDPGS